MSGHNDSATHELYVWHDRETLTTCSRFYVRQPLNRQLFAQKIYPFLYRATNIETEHSVRGYRYYVVVQWLRDFDINPDSLVKIEKEVEQRADFAFNQALGWNASVLRTLRDYGEVRRTGEKLGLNWAKGQFPL